MFQPFMHCLSMNTENSQDKIVIERASKSWASGVFSAAELGDKRRTKRLVEIASNVMCSPGDSFVNNCRGSSAQIEGTYRWLENDSIDYREIVNAGCSSTAAWLDEIPGDIVAAGDTSKISYPHSLREKLGPLSHGAKGGAGLRGILVHSTVFQSTQTGETLGLGDQIYWQRKDSEQGKKHKRKQLDYAQKESFKWEYSISRIMERFPQYLERLVFTSDRESDIYELLMHLVGNRLRYVVRASWNRKLSDLEKGVFDHVSSSRVMGKVLINIPQKGGRRQRRAALEIRACEVILSPPGKDKSLPPVKLNVVQAQELAADDPMNWTLLTSEPIETLEQALYVLRCYGLRWKVEDFHKTWKTGGTNVEGLRLQSPEGLMRAATVLAFVAVRLSQLRDESEPSLKSEQTQMVILSDFTGKTSRKSGKKTIKGIKAPERKCTCVLSDAEWRILWITVEEGRPMPPKPPNRLWAYHAIGRLAGWYDSKRTGRVGMKAFWRGYWELQKLTRAVSLVQQSGISIDYGI